MEKSNWVWARILGRKQNMRVLCFNRQALRLQDKRQDWYAKCSYRDMEWTTSTPMKLFASSLQLIFSLLFMHSMGLNWIKWISLQPSWILLWLTKSTLKEESPLLKSFDFLDDNLSWSSKTIIWLELLVSGMMPWMPLWSTLGFWSDRMFLRHKKRRFFELLAICVDDLILTSIYKRKMLYSCLIGHELQERIPFSWKFSG